MVLGILVGVLSLLQATNADIVPAEYGPKYFDRIRAEFGVSVVVGHVINNIFLFSACMRYKFRVAKV